MEASAFFRPGLGYPHFYHIFRIWTWPSKVSWIYIILYIFYFSKAVLILLFLTNSPVYRRILIMLFWGFSTVKWRSNLNRSQLQLSAPLLCDVRSLYPVKLRLWKHLHWPQQTTKSSGIKVGNIIFNKIISSSTEKLDVLKSRWSETAGKVDQSLEKASDVILWGM